MCTFLCLKSFRLAGMPVLLDPATVDASLAGISAAELVGAAVACKRRLGRAEPAAHRSLRRGYLCRERDKQCMSCCTAMHANKAEVEDQLCKIGHHLQQVPPKFSIALQSGQHEICSSTRLPLFFSPILPSFEETE